MRRKHNKNGKVIDVILKFDTAFAQVLIPNMKHTNK